MSESLEVCLILDLNFGEKLREISPAKITWICDSPQNRAEVEMIWDTLRRTNDQRKDQDHLTLFNDSFEISREDKFIDILPDVDLHHPSWTTLRVYGVQITNAVKQSLMADFNVVEIQNSKDGFVAIRS